MSEKRWALRPGAMVPWGRGSAAMCIEDFEEVEIPGPDESIVPHSVLRAVAEASESGCCCGCCNVTSPLRDYLPKPRPTLREALSQGLRNRGCAHSDTWINELAAKCGIDPDKRMEP